jgi:hypothetical protein
LSTHGSFGWECLKTWPVSANSALAINASFVGFTTGKKLFAFIESSTIPKFIAVPDEISVLGHQRRRPARGRRRGAGLLLIRPRRNFRLSGATDVYATQFHPEKSRKVGLQLLKHFVELAQP